MMAQIDGSDGPQVSYRWSIVMDGGQTISFEGGNTAGAAQFVDEVQRFHVTGQKPETTRNYRFPTFNHSTALAADILVDVSKVQLVLRETLLRPFGPS
jgi:hypothetical protein